MQQTKPDTEELDLKSRLKDIHERLALGISVNKANEQRAVSSAIGAESAYCVLTEIRESQGRMVELLKGLALMEEEREKKEEMRHRELCTILLSMASSVPSTPRVGYSSYDPMTPMSQTPQKSHSYYGGTSLTSSTHLVACVMLHLDNMLIRHPQFRRIQSTDKTFMDIKEWYVLCNAVINADKNSKAGLRMPKPSDEDFKSACRLIASPVEGRRPSCDPSHIIALLTSSPALMNTVEWTRSALIRCPGVLSPERQCRFKSIQHPFLTDEQELNVEQAKTLKMTKRDRHMEVSELKVTQKKEYMRLILELSFTPDEAISRIKGKA